MFKSSSMWTFRGTKVISVITEKIDWIYYFNLIHCASNQVSVLHCAKIYYMVTCTKWKGHYCVICK